MQDAKGSDVALTTPTSHLTYTFSSYAGSNVYELVSAAGTHRISCTIDGSTDTKVVLAFMSGSFTGELVKTLLPLGIGLLLGIGAMVTLFVLRSR